MTEIAESVAANAEAIDRLNRARERLEQTSEKMGLLQLALNGERVGHALDARAEVLLAAVQENWKSVYEYIDAMENLRRRAA